MKEFFLDHIWLTYAIIVVLVSYVYNRVFRVRKLPLLKELAVYVLIALGSIILLFFQLNGLPIIASLSVAIFLMLLVQVRYFVERRAKKKERANEESSRG